MDQPYSRLADTMLDVQYVRGDEKVYDDTGWTLGYLKNVDFKRVANPDVLRVPMHLWSAGPPPSTAATDNADTDFFRAQWANPNAHLPRIALMHTWLRTQDEGWWRLALESMSVPYTYISTQDASRTPNLREKFDVILFPPTGGNNASQEIVNGFPPGPPLPWKKTALTPNLAVDQTDDMRPGLGLAGLENITRFVEGGGLLVTARDTSVWAAEYGLARWVRVVPSQKLRAPGTILSATVTDKKSPIVAGYDDTIPIYFSNSPIFRVGVAAAEPPPETRPSGRGAKNDPDVPQGRAFVPLPERPKPAPGEEGFQPPEDAPWNSDYAVVNPEDRPRVCVSFAKKADQLLLSGMLEGGEELAGKAVVIDAPRGRGHVILFACNPMWRQNTQGSYALVMNAILNWDRLR